eukprot:1159790-Pelagomonas_calceolata.AAC.6
MEEAKCPYKQNEQRREKAAQAAEASTTSMEETGCPCKQKSHTFIRYCRLEYFYASMCVACHIEKEEETRQRKLSLHQLRNRRQIGSEEQRASSTTY